MLRCSMRWKSLSEAEICTSESLKEYTMKINRGKLILHTFFKFLSNGLLEIFRYNNHPVLNDRYLVLMLLGKGGFSEVHKVS